MLKIAICDDNKSICSQIEQIILDYKKLNAVDIDIEVFYSGESLINFIENDHSFDLIFLDIELGTTTGIKVGSKIRKELNDHVIKIVFITAKDGYDRELFDLQPFNFLAKPIDKRKLIQCIELVVELSKTENLYFDFKFKHSFKKIKYKDIIFFESNLKKIKIVSLNGIDEFYGNLESVKNKMPKNFLSCHGSYIINFEYVLQIFKNHVQMINKAEIPISQKNMKTIRLYQIELEKEKRDVRL